MLRAVLLLVVAMVCVIVNISHGYTIKAPGSLGEPPRMRKSWGRQHLLRMGKRSEGGWPSGREALEEDGEAVRGGTDDLGRGDKKYREERRIDKMGWTWDM